LSKLIKQPLQWGKWITGQDFSWNKYIKRASSKDINAYDRYNTFYNKYKNSDTMVWVAYSRQALKTNDFLMFFAELKGIPYLKTK